MSSCLLLILGIMLIVLMMSSTKIKEGLTCSLPLQFKPASTTRTMGEPWGLASIKTWSNAAAGGTGGSVETPVPPNSSLHAAVPVPYPAMTPGDGTSAGADPLSTLQPRPGTKTIPVRATCTDAVPLSAPIGWAPCCPEYNFTYFADDHELNYTVAKDVAVCDNQGNYTGEKWSLNNNAYQLTGCPVVPEERQPGCFIYGKTSQTVPIGPPLTPYKAAGDQFMNAEFNKNNSPRKAAQFYYNNQMQKCYSDQPPKWQSMVKALRSGGGIGGVFGCECANGPMGAAALAAAAPGYGDMAQCGGGGAGTDDAGAGGLGAPGGYLTSYACLTCYDGSAPALLPFAPPTTASPMGGKYGWAEGGAGGGLRGGSVCPPLTSPPATCATSSLSCQTDYTNAKSATTYDGTPGDFQSKCCTAPPTCQTCDGDKKQLLTAGTPCPNADCTACCGAAPTCATSSLSCQTDYANAKSATAYDGTQTDFQSKCCKMNKCSPITYDTTTIVGKAGKHTACSPNLQLAAGSSCDVACVAKYKAATGTFTCNADGTITKAALKCIPPNPQCPTNFPCGAGYHLITPLPITPCAASKCGAGDCCAANPFCVSLPQCKKGRQFQSEYKNIQCKSGVCQDAECCEAIPQPTCQGYPCPTHHTIKANADNVTCTGANGCTDDNCCVANAKPTCASDPMLCPPGYENKPNLSNITCREYACTEADCCVTRPPVPHKPNITDITKTRKIDNRKWIDNSRYIKEYDLKDERTQMGIQSGPQYFYEGAENAGDYDDDFFPPGAFLGFDDNDW